MAAVTRTGNGQRVYISGATEGTGPFIVQAIAAGTTNSLYDTSAHTTATAAHVVWTPNAKGDVLYFDCPIKLDYIACTGASDDYQLFLA